MQPSDPLLVAAEKLGKHAEVSATRSAFRGSTGLDYGMIAAVGIPVAVIFRVLASTLRGTFEATFGATFGAP